MIILMSFPKQLILILLFTSNVYANTSCYSFLSLRKTENFHSTRGQITSILFPMAVKLTETFKALDPAEIRELSNQLLLSQAIRKTKYISVESQEVHFNINLPDLGIFGEDDFIQDSELVMNLNISGGAGHYRIFLTRSHPNLQPPFTYEEFNAARDRTQVAQYDFFNHAERALLLTPLTHENPNWSSIFQSMLQYLSTPVGVYGVSFSENLIKTTQLLINLATTALNDLSRQAYENNSDLLRENTARMRDTSDKNRAALNTMLEGLVSLHQFFAISMMNPVPGYNNGSDALGALIFNSSSRFGLISEYTVRSPMGLIGPMATSGTYFNFDIFETTENGKLKLTDNLISTMDLLKKTGPEYNSLGCCPMAAVGGRSNDNESNQTGLQLLAELFWDAFTYLNDTRL